MTADLPDLYGQGRSLSLSVSDPDIESIWFPVGEGCDLPLGEAIRREVTNLKVLLNTQRPENVLNPLKFIRSHDPTTHYRLAAVWLLDA